MEKNIEQLIAAIENHDAESLPTASVYVATENGVPGALRHMQTFNCFDKVECIGTKVMDRTENRFFLAMNVLQGKYPTLLTVRVQLKDDLMSEIELDIIRSRKDTGFWYAPQDMDGLLETFDEVVPEEKRLSREELEYIGHAVLDNAYDGSKYGREDSCLLMEAGGIVYENTGYAKLINPHAKDFFPDEDTRVPIPIGIAPNRPTGENIRILAIDEERGLVAAYFDVDGIVSPYIVSDETSTCFVPLSMIEGHYQSLKPEFFEGKSVCKEMRATGATINIVKMVGNNVALLMQDTSMRPYGARTAWRKDTFEGLKY